jgi:hypothetical protein
MLKWQKKELRNGMKKMMERLNWKNCKNIEFVADTNKNYSFIIELEDMPFEKGQKIAFDSEGGITYGCVIDKIRGMKIYLIVEEEDGLHN